MVNDDISAVRYVSKDKPGADSAVTHARRLIGHDKRVLEIGPATGILTKLISTEQGCRVTAIEIDPDAAKMAEPFCERIFIADIETDDISRFISDETFDVITFGDVLEHLRSPARALRKVIPYLAPGGFLVVSVPNIAHAAIAYELAHGRFTYRATGLLDTTHIRFFTKENLLELLGEAGLEITDLCRFSLEPRVTEFATTPESGVQRAFLDYLLRINSESRTYQFIARARPRPAAGDTNDTAPHEKETTLLLADRRPDASLARDPNQSSLRYANDDQKSALEKVTDWAKDLYTQAILGQAARQPARD